MSEVVRALEKELGLTFAENIRLAARVEELEADAAKMLTLWVEQGEEITRLREALEKVAADSDGMVLLNDDASAAVRAALQETSDE